LYHEVSGPLLFPPGPRRELSTKGPLEVVFAPPGFFRFCTSFTWIAVIGPPLPTLFLVFRSGQPDVYPIGSINPSSWCEVHSLFVSRWCSTLVSPSDFVDRVVWWRRWIFFPPPPRFVLPFHRSYTAQTRPVSVFKLCGYLFFVFVCLFFRVGLVFLGFCFLVRSLPALFSRPSSPLLWAQNSSSCLFSPYLSLFLVWRIGSFFLPRSLEICPFEICIGQRFLCPLLFFFRPGPVTGPSSQGAGRTLVSPQKNYSQGRPPIARRFFVRLWLGFNGVVLCPPCFVSPESNPLFIALNTTSFLSKLPVFPPGFCPSGGTDPSSFLLPTRRPHFLAASWP